MELTGVTGGVFSYKCSFENTPEIDLIIPGVNELTWANITLESYAVKACTDYPDTNATLFSNIALELSTGPLNPAWTPINAVTECGQHINIIDDDTIEICYR